MRHGSPLVLSLIATALVACGSGSSSPAPAPVSSSPPPADGPRPKPPTTVPQARVRLIHASPNLPMVDFWIKGEVQPLAKTASFGEGTSYAKIPAGKVTLELRASPSRSVDAALFTSAPLDLAADTDTTAIAAGVFDAADAAQALRLLPIVDAFKKTPDKATVRVVHASPDGPTVGIDVGDDDPAKPEIASLARFTDTGAGGVQIAAGEFLQLGIVAGGRRVTSFTTPMLASGSELYLVATGFVGRHAHAADGLALVAIGASTTSGFLRQNPLLYTLHASPDAPAVDVFVGSVEIADNLAFGQLSSPIQVRLGLHDIDFFAHSPGSARPSSPPIATRSSGNLLSGQRYLEVATGFLSRAPRFDVSAFLDENVHDDAVNARVRAVHASPDAPAVDLGIAVGGGAASVVAPGLTFLGSSQSIGLAVAPGSYTFGLTPAGQGTTPVARFPVTLVAGARAFAVAAGALDVAKGQALRMLVVDTNATPWSVASVAPL